MGGQKLFLPSLPPQNPFVRISQNFTGGWPLMSPRSPENLVNVRAIAFLLDMKTHVEPMEEYIVVKKLENGVVIL